MATQAQWLAVIGMGLATYAIRLSMIALLGRTGIPPLVRRALRFVPPAVLSAIILPELLRYQGQLSVSPGNPRLVAGLVAALVAWRSKNALATIAAGMVTLWIVQLLGR